MSGYVFAINPLEPSLLVVEPALDGAEEEKAFQAKDNPPQAGGRTLSKLLDYFLDNIPRMLFLLYICYCYDVVV
jgi:hypothetical protein